MRGRWTAGGVAALLAILVMSAMTRTGWERRIALAAQPMPGAPITNSPTAAATQFFPTAHASMPGAMPGAAFVNPPARFFGSLRIDGVPAPEGTLVTALINGVTCGSRLTNIMGQYRVDAVSDGQRPGCGINETTVSFEVNGRPTGQFGSWRAGQFIQVDLMVSTMGLTQTRPPVSSAMPTPVPTFPPSLPAIPSGTMPGAPTAVPPTGPFPDGSFVFALDSSTWVVSRGVRYGITWFVDEDGILPSLPRGESVSTAAQLAAALAAPRPSSALPELTAALPDGAFLVGANNAAWVVSRGVRYAVTFRVDDTDIIPTLPEGPRVSTAGQLANALATAAVLVPPMPGTTGAPRPQLAPPAVTAILTPTAPAVMPNASMAGASPLTPEELDPELQAAIRDYAAAKSFVPYGGACQVATSTSIGTFCSLVFPLTDGLVDVHINFVFVQTILIVSFERIDDQWVAFNERPPERPSRPQPVPEPAASLPHRGQAYRQT